MLHFERSKSINFRSKNWFRVQPLMTYSHIFVLAWSWILIRFKQFFSLFWFKHGSAFRSLQHLWGGLRLVYLFILARSWFVETSSKSFILKSLFTRNEIFPFDLFRVWICHHPQFVNFNFVSVRPWSRILVFIRSEPYRFWPKSLLLKIAFVNYALKLRRNWSICSFWVCINNSSFE